MDPSQFYQEWERLYTIRAEELYNQYAGFTVNKERMEKAARDIVSIAKEYLQQYKPEDQKLKLGLVQSVRRAEQVVARSKLIEERNKLISSKKRFKDRTVNWGNWRQFNAEAEATERKVVFDEFIRKASLIQPFILNFFEIGEKTYSDYATSSLDAYLHEEEISYQELHKLLERLGDRAKSPFLKGAEYYSKELFGKSFEYYDDMYVFRSRIYGPLSKYFAGLKSPVKSARQVFGEMGLDISRIDVDNEDRPGKTPSAVCFSIQVPNDIRILFRKTDPYENTSSVFHEMGHGIHGSSGIPEEPIWNRYFVPKGVAETFAILFENLVENPLVLSEAFGLGEEAINEVVNRRHFMNLWVLVFYAANGILKLEYWHDNLTMEEAVELYERLTTRFFHKVPGNYWMLHHVMPNYNLYSPSYMMASVRVGELEQLLETEYGEYWWKDRKAGKFLTTLMSQRNDIDLSWSKLDPQPLLRNHIKLNI